MSFQDCLRVLGQAGTINPREARELREAFDAALQASGGDRVVARQAVERALAERGQTMTRRAYLQQQALLGVQHHMATFRRPNGRADPGEAFVELVRNVELDRRVILGEAHAQLDTLLAEGQRHWLLGDPSRRYIPWQRARLNNIVREAFGEATGDDAARIAARAWTETADGMRQEFNHWGGDIGQLQNWGLPQSHNPLAMLAAAGRRADQAAARTAWKAFTLDRLDPARMRDPLTGGPMTRAGADQALDHVWDTVISRGLADEDPGARLGDGPLYRRHADHRFLVFRDASAWLEYQQAFGNADPFATMMQHINVMSRDIAAIRALGPNPNTALDLARNTVKIEAGEAAAGRRNVLEHLTPQQLLSYASGPIAKADAMWSLYTGATNAPGLPWIATALANVRNLITATSLRRASLSAISDVGTQQVARHFVGMTDTGALGIMRDVLAQFRGMNEREAVRAGLINDVSANALAQQARYVGTFQGSKWTAYVADRVLTGIGLTPWTQGGRHAFGLSFLGQMYDRAERGFDALEPAWQATLGRHGIDAAAWDGIRAGRRHAAGDMLDATAIRASGDAPARDLARRYMRMVLLETDHAVINATLETRAIMLGTTRPGTYTGEVARATSMFKSFGVTIAMMHGRRVAAEVMAGRGIHGAGYAAALITAGMVYGAIALTLKDVEAGKDVRPIDLKFAGAALLQGGGLGIYGDFLFADASRVGGSLPTTFAGPLVGRLNTIQQLTWGNVQQRYAGKSTRFGREAVNLAREWTPLPFYLYRPFERGVLDHLQRLADPEMSDALRRRIETERRDYKRGFWWEPGRTFPSRLPQLPR